MADTPDAERRLYWLSLALENAKEEHTWDKQRGRKNEAQGNA